MRGEGPTLRRRTGCGLCRPQGEQGCGPTVESTEYGLGKRGGAVGPGCRRRRQLWLRLNKAGRVLQASGPESDVVNEEVSLASSADERVVEQPDPEVLGNRGAQATQRQKRSWVPARGLGVVEAPTTLTLPAQEAVCGLAGVEGGRRRISPRLPLCTP